MRLEELSSLLEESPIIAAVKDDVGLRRCLGCGCRVVFMLYGDVLTIADKAALVKSAGKAAFVHIDLIDGLSPRETAVDYIARAARPDGIITTKTLLARRAGTLGLLTVQRFFLLDSIALENAKKQMAAGEADLVEVLPGVMPKIIRRLAANTDTPIITGGLISDKEDVMAALSAGAAAVSSTNERVWEL